MIRLKKLTAMLLCFALAAGLLPVSALAEPTAELQSVADGAEITVKEAEYEDGTVYITVNSSKSYRGGRIAVACYDADGKMTNIDMFSVRINSGDNSFTKELPSAFDTCKVFVVDSEYRPCCAAVEAAEYVAPDPSQHNIYYDIANGDPYIQRLVDAGMVDNPNPIVFSEKSALTLKNIVVYGYRFLGWYDMPAGANAQFVRRIPAGTDYDVYLYAHWEKIEYTVQFKSDVFIDTNEITYTVDKGAVLPTPKLSNYVFAGWSDETGHLYKGTTIPVGTTGNIVLTANWTSERNKTWTKTELDDPIIYEDEENNTILFAYEIGEIQNVPLYTIKDFGYISGDGVTKTETTTYTMKTNDTYMQSYAKAVASATTESSDITLSSGWQGSSYVNNQWTEERGLTEEEANSIATSRTGSWNVSSGTSGSREVTVIDSNGREYKSQAKIGLTSSRADGINENVGYSEKTAAALDVGVDIGLSRTKDKTTTSSKGKYTNTDKGSGGFLSDVASNIIGGVAAELIIAALLSDGTEDTKTKSKGISTTLSADLSAEASGSIERSKSYDRGHVAEKRDAFEYERVNSSGATSMHTNSATDVSAWNRNTSYGGSETVSENNSTARIMSQKIAETTGYGKEYIENENWQNTQGFSSTNSSSDEYSVASTYSAEETKTVTSTWTTTSTKAGYHRWVVAGTAHVFAIVGYNMRTSSYFMYTYSVMDDETHEFEDYSYTTALFNDNENGVIPFEIPYFVCEYVANRVAYSEGLKVNKTTGVITDYTGDFSYVVIPEYMNVGNGEVVKVTGLSSDAFNGKTHVKAVVLSDFINEIPDNAFRDCSSLLGVSGYGVKVIGNNSFAGCQSMITAEVSSDIQALGLNAFTDVPNLIIDSSNIYTAAAGVNSGAKQITLNTDDLQIDENDTNRLILDAPSGTEYFEFNGFGQTFDRFVIKSLADKTVINKATFNSTDVIPVQIASPDVIMNDVTVNAPGIAMVLAAENTSFGLEGVVSVNSDNVNTLLSKNLTLYESNPLTNGILDVSGKMLVSGTVQNRNLLTCGEYVEIDDAMFDQLLHSYKLFFDPQGGSCTDEYKEIPNGTPIGTLPVPTRQYYSFAGWFLADGTQVNENTVFSSGMDQTLYAHWNPITFTVTFDAQGGSASQSSKTVTFGSSIGALPSAQKDHQESDGWFLSDGTQINENTVFSTAENRTVYAHWHDKPIKGWVKASEVPAGAQIVERKYTYTQRYYTTSSSSSMSGWTKYDSSWVWSNWGSWSSWSDNAVYASDSRQVETRSVVASEKYKTVYHYYRWAAQREGGYGSYKQSNSYPNYYTLDTDSPLEETSAIDGHRRFMWWYSSSHWVGMYMQDPYTTQELVSQTWKTQYRYRDRYQVYTYYFYRDENKESTSYPSGSDISNVVELVKYREK